MAHWVVTCTTEANLADREPTKCATARVATMVYGQPITTEAEAIAFVQEHCAEEIAAKLPDRILAAWHAHLEEP